MEKKKAKALDLFLLSWRKKPKTLDHGENKKLKKALDLLLVVIERKKLWIFCCCCCGDGEKTGAWIWLLVVIVMEPGKAKREPPGSSGIHI
jgi:hypothetical protein